MPRFPGQFLIHKDRANLPEGFNRRELEHGFLLDTAPDLPIVTVQKNGRTIGYLLGFPVDLKRSIFLEDGDRLDLCDNENTSPDIDPEAVLGACAGSFVLLLLAGDEVRLYLDACGTYSLVFDPEKQCAGSTSQLLAGGDYEARFLPDLYKAFEVEGDGWFTAGLTAHQGIYRLLTNHCLEMGTMQVRRHWPSVLPAYTDDPGSVILAIGEEVAKTTAAIDAKKSLAMALTGGFETRALLACCREQAGKIRFATVELPQSARDVELARRIAKLANLEHTVLPCKKSTQDEAEQWTRLAGHCLTGANRIFYPSTAPLAGHVLIGGLGGEVGRGFLWPEKIPQVDAIDAAFVIDRLKLPRHPLLLEHVGKWIDELPKGLDAYQILDLAYVELRMGTWAFAQTYTNMAKIDLHPLISRTQFVRMWSLPPALRRKSGLMQRMVELHWPELLSVPINAYGDWRDKAAPILRVIKEPSRAYRKLRQIVRRRLV